MNGVLLKMWMKENGVKPEQLAVQLGISYPTVRAMMGGRKPFRTTITVLAGLMGIPEQELMGQSKKIAKNQKASVA